MAGSVAVNPGQVNFCDASAPYCSDTHLLGTAQLSPAGTATLKFVPGIGVHSYKAVFLGTSSDAASSSSESALTVTGSGSYPTTTSIVQTGGPGNYTLAATVSGNEGIVPAGTVSFLDTNNSNDVLATAMLGAGQGTPTLGFLNSSNPATNLFPISIAVADFNGDGKADMAITTGDGSGVLNILLGNGDGTFTAAPAPPITGNASGSIVVGDFNGDGKADLALTFPNNYLVQVLLGKGDGTFTAGQTIPDTDGPVFVTTGDFNGDGKADLAVINPAGSNVSILLGDGDGTFTKALTVPVEGYASFIAVADFNGDGNADLAITENNTLVVLLGEGNGNFNAVSASSATGDDPMSIVTGDFNGDGKPDLAIANAYFNTGEPGSVTILLGKGDGTFAPSTTLATGYQTYSVAVGDFNGDGNADLVAVNTSGDVANVPNGIGIGTASILLGNGDGTFTTAPSPAVGENPLIAAVGDFNGDGLADFVVTNNINSSLTVMLSQLTEKATVTVSGVSPLGSETHAVSASYSGDVNYSASVSGPTGLLAQPGTTTTVTTLGSTANPQVAGGLVMFVAQVTPAPASGTAYVVNITFDNGTPVTLPLSSGEATFGIRTLTPGVHNVMVRFPAQGTYAASSSVVLQETVSTAPAGIATATGSGQSVGYGLEFTRPLVAIVTDPHGNPVAGATVTFSGTGLRFSSTTAVTNSSGEATVRAYPTTAGALTAFATVSGVGTAANFSLNATKAMLLVKANSATYAFNQQIPAPAYSFSGFVNGDTATTAVTGSASISTPAKQGSPAGTYPIGIVQGTLSAPNYNLEFEQGTVTITP